MSVIVAIARDSRVCMAADSQATNNGSKLQLARTTAKIVRLGDFLFSISSLPVGEFLRRRCSVSPLAGLGLDQAAALLADSLRQDFKERALLEVREGQSYLPGEIIVARGSEFVILDSLGSVMRADHPWWALGSGGPEARAVLYALCRDDTRDTEWIARLAVDAACALDNGCSPPIVVEWTNPA